MPRNRRHTITVDKLIPGGAGLGRLADGMVVLVDYVLPGEKVQIREKERKKNYLQSDLVEVLSPAPERTRPPCPHYLQCGGCDLQHASAAAQILLKESMLTESLQRAAGELFNDPAPEITVLSAPDQFNYRQRLRLQVDRQGNYGFYQPRTHRITPVKQCLLAGKQLNSVLLQLDSSRQFRKLARHCSGFELLYNPDADETLLLLHFARKPRPNDSSLALELKDHAPGLGAILMQVEGYGMYDPLARVWLASPPVLAQSRIINVIQSTITFTWEAGGFSQVNPAQNDAMIDLVLTMIGGGPHKNVLDLYCGYGNFSLPAADLAERVLGIDFQNSAIRSGRRNAELNRINNCHFKKNQVPDAVTLFLENRDSFDTVILDPPRRGAPEIASLLPKLAPEQIIYISCNPATLARDLVQITAGGYQLIEIVGVDMFPQTHHLEAIARLRRAG